MTAGSSQILDSTASTSSAATYLGPDAVPSVPGETSAAKKLRVCHVSLTLCTGGLERLLVDFARFHDRRRFELEFVALRDVGRFAEEIRSAGLTVHQLPDRGRVREVRALRRLFRERGFDVVHTHNTYPHLYASLAARLAGVPVIVNTRHGQRLGHGWKSRQLYRWASRLTDRMVSVSEDAARMCVSVDGVASARVQRIWNGIDLDKFEYRGPAGHPTAIAVARLSPEKDFATLLEATVIVAGELPDFRLIIAGDGPLRAELEQHRDQAGLQKHVTFLGDRSDIPQLMGEAGFFVSSSVSEGISLTLLEAMASGLPVVATEVGGNPEILGDDETGSLVPSRDPSALAQAMIAMCRRQDEWRAIGARGRERIATCFDVRRMVTDYETLYADIHGHRSARQSSR